MATYGNQDELLRVHTLSVLTSLELDDENKISHLQYFWNKLQNEDDLEDLDSVIKNILVPHPVPADRKKRFERKSPIPSPGILMQIEVSRIYRYIDDEKLDSNVFKETYGISEIERVVY